MKIDMKERMKYLEIKTRSNLLNYPMITSLYLENPYYYTDLLQDMKNVLLNDKFLYLISDSLLGEIKDFTYKVHFVVSKSHRPELIRECASEIRNKIQRVENTNQMMKNAIIRKAIEDEKRLRDIPQEFPLELEDVLEFYRLDYVNMTTITCPKTIDTASQQDLFCFLATIHKLCKDCPSDIKEREEFTKQIIGRIDSCNPKYAPIIEKYCESTIELLCKSQEERERSHKIIDFSKVLKK